MKQQWKCPFPLSLGNLILIPNNPARMLVGGAEKSLLDKAAQQSK